MIGNVLVECMGWMNGRMDVWWMNGWLEMYWLNRWVDEWLNACMIDGYIDWISFKMYWLNGWVMNGWVDVWQMDKSDD